MRHSSEFDDNYNHFRSHQITELNQLIVAALRYANDLNLDRVSLLLIDAMYFVLDEQEIKIISDTPKGN